jgi:hypothetical protein
MGAAVSRNSLNQSRAAPCGGFACEIREIRGLFCAIRENRFKINRAFPSNHDDEAESLLSGRLK